MDRYTTIIHLTKIFFTIIIFIGIILKKNEG